MTAIGAGGESADLASRRDRDDLPASRTLSVSEPRLPADVEDDLTLIEGIGPKIAALLKQQGIRTFADLAAMDTAQLNGILRAAGPRYRTARVDSWPEQARLAGAGAWDDLKSLQSRLSGRMNR
jgi:predicted flap endonuclease-1-like 5' DNA nuclease